MSTNYGLPSTCVIIAPNSSPDKSLLSKSLQSSSHSTCVMTDINNNRKCVSLTCILLCCIYLHQDTPTVDFSSNEYAQKEFKFYDNRLWELVQQGDYKVHQFFRLLALCHTVMPEHKNGSLPILVEKSSTLMQNGYQITIV